MEDTFFEILKDCNIKLDALRTKDYRFLAWIIYSTQHKCFIAGVDTYSNDKAFVILKSVDASPLIALNKVFSQVNKWYGEGFIPLDDAPFFE
jgi:hypothetical protein